MHPKDIFHEEDVSNDRPLVSSAGRAPVWWAGGRRFQTQAGPTLTVLKESAAFVITSANC